MAKANMGRIIGILSAAATLTACQGLPGVPRAYTPTFKVEALPDGAAAVGSSAGSTAVEVAGVTPAHAGKLVVQFGHLLPKAEARRLMATIADVETITITLSGNGVNHTQTIPKAAIVNGATSFTFTGLPPGALTVTIKALNASNAVIGQDIQQATVTAGQTTVVTSTVTITPTIPTPRVIVGGSGGGSGGATGSLTTNVTLRDDVPVIAPPVLGVHAPAIDDATGFYAHNVVLDGQGNAWFAGDFSIEASPQKLGKVTPADALTYVNAPAGATLYFIGASRDRSRVLVPNLDGSTTFLGFAADGSVATAAAPILSALRLAQAPDGTLYAVDAQSPMGDPSDAGDIRRMAPNGTLGVLWDAQAQPEHAGSTDVTTDAAGNPIATIYANEGGAFFTPRIEKFLPDGTSVFARRYGPSALGPAVAADSQNQIWVLDPASKTLEKLSPTGQLLGSFPTPARCTKLYIDAADRVWTYQSAGVNIIDHMEMVTTGEDDDVISRFSNAGVLQAYYQVGQDADTEQIAVSADDHLWVASKKKGLIHLKLDPLP